ncbi:MAG TPA: glycoside hydrolase family 15 protein [Baekduia sp.]|nr:glycoside hydrolase family 15 protein [Baekduia sp.]
MSSEHAPPIEDYGFLSDGASVALVSRAGSVDWCCVPRVDRGACFARLLGWEQGGFWRIAPAGHADVRRRYVDGSLLLETTFATSDGEVRLVDLMTIDAEHGDATSGSQLVRLVEGVSGQVDLDVALRVRFDFGALRPWRRRRRDCVFDLIGGDDGLRLAGTAPLEPDGRHDLAARITVREGDRLGWVLRALPPHRLDGEDDQPPAIDELWRRADATEAWWRDWSDRATLDGPRAGGALRSAMVLKGLANRATGAIAAAATTSLPESAGGTLNWDYRFSWIRDSVFSVRSLREAGYGDEADAFRRFIERSAAGSADQLQIMFGMGGERTLTERELDHLPGYQGAAPVRIGNAAAKQLQLDSFGELVELSWRWLQHGHVADDDYWAFLVDLVDTAARRWSEPDQGLWEMRGDPRHFVHSKVMCWAALDRGLRIAEHLGRDAPVERWRAARDEVRAAVESRGYDERRGVFVQAFDRDALDAALLLLPGVGFVDYDDERMVRTVDAIRAELDADGLLLRYRREHGHGEPEGAFVACTFWLAECLARQGRRAEAEGAFARAAATANDLGLFAEEYDAAAGRMLGNFPQALTHLAHLGAAVALDGGSA